MSSYVCTLFRFIINNYIRDYFMTANDIRKLKLEAIDVEGRR